MPNFKLPKGTNCMPFETEIDRNARAIESLKEIVRHEFANRHYFGMCCGYQTRCAIGTLRRFKEAIKFNRSKES